MAGAPLPHPLFAAAGTGPRNAWGGKSEQERSRTPERLLRRKSMDRRTIEDLKARVACTAVSESASCAVDMRESTRRLVSGAMPAFRWAEPFHVLFQVKRRANSPPCRRRGGRTVLAIPLGRERSDTGDGRSIFHTRVGYRRSVFRRGLPLTQSGRRSMPAHWALEGCLTFRSAPGRTAGETRLRGRRRHCLADRPDEAAKLAGDRGDHDRRLLAAGSKLAVAITETDLRLPGDVTHGLWLL